MYIFFTKRTGSLQSFIHVSDSFLNSIAIYCGKRKGSWFLIQ